MLKYLVNVIHTLYLLVNYAVFDVNYLFRFHAQY